MRSERWFEGKVNAEAVLRTGGMGWQDIAREDVKAEEGNRGEDDVSTDELALEAVTIKPSRRRKSMVKAVEEESTQESEA